MKFSKGRSQPQIAAAAFLVLYMVLGGPCLYRVLIVTQLWFDLVGLQPYFGWGLPKNIPLADVPGKFIRRWPSFKRTGAGGVSSSLSVSSAANM